MQIDNVIMSESPSFAKDYWCSQSCCRNFASGRLADSVIELLSTWDYGRRTLKMINAAIPPIFTCLSPRKLLDMEIAEMEALVSGSIADDVIDRKSSRLLTF